MPTSARTDCYDYVRRCYHVPAYVGVRVKGDTHEGVIVAAKTDLHYVHVRFDGKNFTDRVHPLELLYLVERQGTEQQ